MKNIRMVASILVVALSLILIGRGVLGSILGFLGIAIFGFNSQKNQGNSILVVMAAIIVVDMVFLMRWYGIIFNK